MQNTHTKNLLFLFSLAPLAAGCPADDDGDDGNDDDGTSDSSSTGNGPVSDGAMTTLSMTTLTQDDGMGTEAGTTIDPGTTGGMATTDASGSSGDTGSSGDHGSSDTGSSDTGSSGDTSSTDTGSGTSEDVNAACLAYVEWLADCYGYDDEVIAAYASACSGYLQDLAIESGQGCVTALEEEYVCLSMLECKPPEGACAEQSAAVALVCDFGDTTGSNATGGDSEPPPP